MAREGHKKHRDTHSSISRYFYHHSFHNWLHKESQGKYACSKKKDFFWCLTLFICYSYKISFLTGFRLRGRSSQRGKSLSLGNLFLVFLFGLLHSLSQKFSMFCTSSLFFLVYCFFRAIHRCSCCRIRGVTRCWILGAFAPGLPSLFRGFLTIYWRTSSSLEILKKKKEVCGFC